MFKFSMFPRSDEYSMYDLWNVALVDGELFNFAFYNYIKNTMSSINDTFGFLHHKGMFICTGYWLAVADLALA